MSITVALLTTTVMNAVGAERAGTASGINDAVWRTAALFAIAVLGAVLTSAFENHRTNALAATHAPAELLSAVTAQHQRIAGNELPVGTPAVLAAALHRAIGVSFVAGFRTVVPISAALALLSAASAWRLIDGKPRAA